MSRQINKLKIVTEVKGAGDSVVFVHGLGGSLNIWHSQTAVCSRFFKTLSYDLRGSGRSDLSEMEYSMDVWVEDLKHLLQSESIESAHLVAHSMGTLIVQHFAVKYPEMVKSLTLVGGIIEQSEAARKGTADRAALVEEKGMEAVADTIIEGGFSSYSKHAHTALIGMVREMLLRNSPKGYAASCRALANTYAIEHGKVKVPVLLIVGDEDKVSPIPMARKLQTGFKQAELKVFTNCGHWATIECPEMVNQALLSFLAKQ